MYYFWNKKKLLFYLNDLGFNNIFKNRKIVIKKN